MSTTAAFAPLAARGVQTPARRKLTGDQRFVLYTVLAALLIIVGVAIFAPAQMENDTRPSTYNAGPDGAKAAYVLLPRLGYRVDRSSDAIASLPQRDASHTTLVIARPFGEQNQAETHALESFLQRGGRILATGDFGVEVLPGLFWKDYADSGKGDRCRTEPEGTSDLARAGAITFPNTGMLARTDLAETHVAQRCPGGAAVVWYRMGAGTAIWWAGNQPLTNRGLHTDSNLQLLLASLGPAGRTVVFDESEENWQPASPWSKTAGLPIAAIVAQLLLAFLFAVLAFSRRHGPVRTLQTTPRTSPLEFAESMGALYHRAGAGEAATQEARRSLLDLLQRQCGLPLETVRGPASGIVAALDERFGFQDPQLAALLESTAEPTRVSPARALTMVQSMHRIATDLRSRIRRGPTSATKGHTERQP